jgi:integrase
MVRKTTRRGRRVLVIDFTYTKPDGAQGRYRRDAAVQTKTAADTEDAARRMGATLYGDPEILCGANGQPLKAVEEAPSPEPAKELTFKDVVASYLAEYAPSAMSPSTVDGYKSRLETHVVPRVGNLPLSQAFAIEHSRRIDVAMVEATLSLSTRQQTFLAVRSVARYAVEANLLAHLPAFLPLPRRGKRIPCAPAACDVTAAIEAASCLAHQLVMLLAAHAGLRKGEIRALRCMDCEMERDRLVVRLSRYKDHTKPTKSGHEREVPLTPQLRAALIAAGVDKRPREQSAALNSKELPWGWNGPCQVLQKTLKRLKLPAERLHGLRAFFVTTLLNGHVPVHVVRELVGHGDLATTQAYAAVVAGDRGAAVTVLDRVYQQALGDRGEPAVALARSRRPTRRRRRLTGRIRELRRRVERRRSAGNSLETPPIAAE